jgi:NAD(P)-dependent dehydrogenase (short-subunit alcohol dehydrogenase family)
LAAHGATVYLACRTKDKADTAIVRLEQEVPQLAGADRLRFIQIDLGDMHSVKRAAGEFLARETRLDVLGALYSCDGARPVVLTKRST